MYKISKTEFEEKFRLYSQELMNISYGYTKSRDDSFDVVQNVFYKLFNSNKSFSTPNDEKYWLIRVTINESKDLLRQRKKVAIVDENTIDIFTDDKEAELKNQRLKKLSQIVGELPEKYRSVIILYYYDQLPIKDITIILKLSESAVKKRLERARNMLKKEMEE